MDKNLKQLQKIIPIIAKLVDGNDLAYEETEKLVYTIFVHDIEGYHLATFIGAIHAKGETADELLGFINAYKKLGVRIKNIDSGKVIDLSGTGGGSFKTINTSTTASFIVAAADYKVAKQAFFGVTSLSGSADLFLAFGIDILKVTKETLEDTLTKIGICPFFTSFMSPKLANIDRLDRKIFVERQIRVRSPFHLVTNIYCPIDLKHRLYGCYSEKYLGVLGELFSKLGFKRSLVVYGEIGIPEVSNVGKTYVVEQNGKELKKYTLTPKDLGVREARLEDIKTGGKEQNIIDFLRVLHGKERGPKRDIVLANAGAAFYVLDKVKNFKEGVRLAATLIDRGKAKNKLKE